MTQFNQREQSIQGPQYNAGGNIYMRPGHKSSSRLKKSCTSLVVKPYHAQTLNRRGASRGWCELAPLYVLFRIEKTQAYYCLATQYESSTLLECEIASSILTAHRLEHSLRCHGQLCHPYADSIMDSICYCRTHRDDWRLTNTL
jgi:hypothetical protein